MSDEEGIEQPNLAKTVLKNSFWSFSASVVARIGGLIFTILIARMLQPELFGIYSLVLSVMLIFLTLTDIGINATLTRYLSYSLGKNNKEKAKAYFNYIFKIKLSVTIILSILLLILAYPLSIYIFNKPELFLPLIICSIYLFFLSFIGFYEGILYATQKVKYITIKEIIYQILRISLALLGIYLILNKVVGTISGLIIATIFALAFLCFSVYKTQDFLYKTPAKLEKSEKSKMLKFMFYLTFGSITAAFFSYIDIVMLGIFVESEFIGYYRAASSMAFAIAALISMANVLLPVFVQLEGKKLERVFNKVFRYLALISFPCTFGLILIAKPFINIIFGSNYIQAAIPLYILSFLIIETAMTGIVSWLFAAKEKPEITTKLLIISTIMNICLNYILIVSLIGYGQIYAVLGAAIATFISRYFNLILLIKNTKSKLNLKINLKNLSKPLIASLVMLVSLAIFQQATKLAWPKSIVEIIFGAFVYLAVIILIKGITKDDLKLLKQLNRK